MSSPAPSPSSARRLVSVTAAAAITFSAAALAFRSAVRYFFRYEERLTPSQWVERHIILPPGKQETKHGPVRFDRRPYQRAPIDDLATAGITDIVYIAPTRSGKTFIHRMGLAWTIAGDPAPSLWIDATETTAKRVSKKEIQPLIDYNPVLRSRRPQQRHHNTDLAILFPAASLNMCGGNSDANVTGDTVQRIWGNELDKWRLASDKEASIAEQSRHRTESYDAARRHIWSTTPTLEEMTGWQFYLRGDQRKWHCVCPRCETPQQLVWRDDLTGAGVVWSRAARSETGRWDLDLVRATARYSCANPACAAHDPRGEKVTGWTDAERIAAITDPRSEWRPAAKGEPGWRSYHVNGLYGPLDVNSCASLAVDYLSAKRAGWHATLQDFWNNRMGMPWRDEVSLITSEKFAARELSYIRGSLPDGVRPDLLVTGFDVQSNRLEFIIRAFTWDGASYLVDHGQVSHWADLENIQRTYAAKWRSATSYVIGDVNYEERRAEALEQIYVRKHLGWYAAEAFETARDLVRIDLPDAFLGGKRQGQGHTIQRLNISAYDFKVELEKRFTGEIPGWHTYQLPLAADQSDIDEQADYYTQLLGERRIPRRPPVQGKPPYKWKEFGPNHAFDCEVYALSLFWLLQKRRAYSERKAQRDPGRQVIQVSKS